MRNVHKKIRDYTSRLTKIRGARTDDTNTIEQAHMMIHLQTEVRDVRGGRYLENLDQTITDVIWQLTRGFFLPAVGNLFEIKRRKSALNIIFKSKVKLRRFIGFTVAQDSSRFTRIVIAVVEEVNNLTTDFTLQP